MSKLAVEIDRNAVAGEDGRCREGRRERRGRGAGARRHAGTLGGGAVRAAVIATMRPRRRTMVFRCLVALVPHCRLVLRAVGPLQRTQPHTGRGHDAQHQEENPGDPDGPGRKRNDHDGTIGARSATCNGRAGFSYRLAVSDERNVHLVRARA
jgi:hypothetical protein